MDNKELLRLAIEASLAAGKIILEIYEGDHEVEYKEDNSPLTKADKRSHLTIINQLSKSKFNTLSEEGKEIPFDERKRWENYWLIDPLDGTKEFIKKNGEFTVNVALISGNYPVIGVVYAPVKKQFYFAAQNIGAFYYVMNGSEISSSELIDNAVKIPIEREDKIFTAVASRSHMNEETSEFVKNLEEKNGKINLISAGSSLKLCLVAEGKADIYPRLAPTMEWDTAAGQAIVECAGKEVVNYKTGERLNYNKENLLNDWFIVREIK
ncbi:MAG: 3'(2'),5'-bisphosphate nucleotidase CysQ [Nitrosopumilus sp.]|nr:3'(2'),5'-bisphosphate nucleotidase CysQ [Nitrosopumilus sp.]